jgi:hypothetical protein
MAQTILKRSIMHIGFCLHTIFACHSGNYEFCWINPQLLVKSAF